MTRPRTALASLAAAAWLASCAPPPPLSVDPRIAVRPDTGLAASDPPIVTTDTHGFTRVSAPLRNLTGHDVSANCNAEWYDADGHPMGGLAATPQRVTAGPFAVAVCELVSPSPRAQRFSIDVVPTP